MRSLWIGLKFKAWRPGSGENWDLLKSGQLVDSVPARGQVGPDAIQLLTVGAATTIRSSPSSSAEIVGLAPTGASVKAAAQYLEWVLIIDPWSWETGWIHSKALAPYQYLSHEREGPLDSQLALLQSQHPEALPRLAGGTYKGQMLLP
jgi:hypothetical protein